MSRKRIHVITGCTAVGKTELALRWAEAHGAEIVSCDSLLFYRGMDIGTAKPTAEERARVPHHLIDVCEPSEPMDIARYCDRARAVVEQLSARQAAGVPILVTGGSGFYLKAFFAPVVDRVAVPEEIRTAVAALSLDEAVAELRRLNPSEAALGGLDLANPRRVARALERCLATGKTVAELRREFAAQPSLFADYELRLTELVREPDDLARRVRERVAAMLRAGLLDEVHGLLTRGIKENPSAAGAIGYRESIAVLEGRAPLAELEAQIVRNTLALVKKQKTFFRAMLPEHERVDLRQWVDVLP
ncbi:tRNA dimethylallyltransferase [Cephaloticoccus capnophilus]|uniref:tRNA dimethylallyltransferase n=1 Tax=Cephaloticoccus capnophilus TaxID=1548208 RepID=A0A139SKH5_9BACT|nr:tRNA (adenosine(37)-N6)-dimethylallyltransferase MiaA [Cephaloticoccus capnophilus]KXU35020.1 tRNA dimethylallyltransferase [Cephaloticoccus capnophilus]